MTLSGRLLCLLLVSLVCGSAAANPLTGIVTPRDVRQGYVELRMNALLAEPLQSSGELLYAADGTLTKFVQEPVEEVIVISAAAVQLERNGKVRVLPASKAPQLAEYYAGLKALLDGDLAAIEQIFTVAEIRAGDDWSVMLIPRSAQLQLMASKLTVAGHASRLQEIHIEQPESAWQTIRIAQQQRDE